jgi:cbb3-type cytochrome oxidase maturation protein
MGIIVLLITISVTIAIGFLAIFYWNIKNGQYDDTYTPSVRMLFEDFDGKTDLEVKGKIPLTTSSKADGQQKASALATKANTTVRNE